MNQNIDFEIIWKKIHHQTTEEEEILLQKWLDQDDSHQKYFRDALNYYSNGTQFANTREELKTALKKIHRKAGIHIPSKSKRIILITSITGIAASILFLIYFQFNKADTIEVIKVEEHAQSIVPGSNKAVLILADGSEHDLTSGTNSIITTEGTEIKNSGNKLEYSGNNEVVAEIKYNTLKIPRGGEYFLIMADSTKVWLNSETTLRFPVQFAGDVRRVELIGEAYFEVTRKNKIPFIVVSGNQQVRVLGTQFNISSYPENSAIYTTLVEGSVEVTLEGNPEEKISLKPSEQGYFLKNENNIQKRNVDVNQYIAWKDGRFVFSDQLLGDIMETLSKWYDVQVTFSDEELKTLRFTGNLERHADFSDILGKIQRTNEVKFEITNKLITIKR
jgi:ferric-dicitrate binding protein FerR (iron transport regulator)